MKTKSTGIVLIAIILCLLPVVWVQASSGIVEMSVETEFEDVSIDLESAIANLGFGVDFKNHVSGMLNLLRY